MDIIKSQENIMNVFAYIAHPLRYISKKLMCGILGNNVLLFIIIFFSHLVRANNTNGQLT